MLKIGQQVRIRVNVRNLELAEAQAELLMWKEITQQGFAMATAKVQRYLVKRKGMTKEELQQRGLGRDFMTQLSERVREMYCFVTALQSVASFAIENKGIISVESQDRSRTTRVHANNLNDIIEQVKAVDEGNVWWLVVEGKVLYRNREIGEEE